MLANIHRQGERERDGIKQTSHVSRLVLLVIGVNPGGFGGRDPRYWDVMAYWLRRLLSIGGSGVRLPLWPSRRDLGQVLYLQLPVRFGVKLRYSVRAVVGSASEW